MRRPRVRLGVVVEVFEVVEIAIEGQRSTGQRGSGQVRQVDGIPVPSVATVEIDLLLIAVRPRVPPRDTEAIGRDIGHFEPDFTIEIADWTAACVTEGANSGFSLSGRGATAGRTRFAGRGR